MNYLIVAWTCCLEWGDVREHTRAVDGRESDGASETQRSVRPFPQRRFQNVAPLPKRSLFIQH